MTQPAHSNPFAFRHPITLDTLDELFSHHRRLTGGWSMEEPGDAGAGGTGDAGAGGTGDAGHGGGAGNATDAKSNDLGFPANTPVAEMSAEQQAAYYRHQQQKWQGRFKNLVGDRSFDEAKADLDAYAEYKKSQQTPAEQQLEQRYAQGRADANAEANTKAATAILRATLAAQDLPQDEIDGIVEPLDLTKFFTEDGSDVDVDKLTAYGKRFAPAGKAKERRDFGAGHRAERRDGKAQRGAAGKAEAQRRFQNQS